MKLMGKVGIFGKYQLGIQEKPYALANFRILSPAIFHGILQWNAVFHICTLFTNKNLWIDTSVEGFSG